MALSERVGLGRWLAIAAGLLGCLLVMSVNPLSFDYDKADILELAAGMAWALGSVVIRRFPNADFLHITFMQYSVGGLLAGTAAFVMGGVSGKASLDCGLASCVFGLDGGVFALGIIDFSDYAICITGAGWHFDVVRGTGCGIVILVVFAGGLNPVAMGRRAGDFGNRGVCRSDRKSGIILISPGSFQAPSQLPRCGHQNYQDQAMTARARQALAAG